MSKEKQILLQKLKQLLEDTLKSKPLDRAIEYYNNHKDNFSLADLNVILSDEFVSTINYNKSKQEFEELRDCFQNYFKNQQKQELKSQTSIDEKSEEENYILNKNQDYNMNQEFDYDQTVHISDLDITYIPYQDQQSALIDNIDEYFQGNLQKKQQITSQNTQTTQTQQQGLQGFIKKRPEIQYNQTRKDIVDFRLIYRLTEDQSSEQSLKKIQFLERNFDLIQKQDDLKEFEILGFYGLQQFVIKNVEDWMDAQIRCENGNSSRFEIYAGIKDKKIAVFLLTDDQMYIEPYVKGSEIQDFIKILQDLCSEVRICVNSDFEVNAGKSPFNIKTKARIVTKEDEKYTFKLQIESLQDKNQLEKLKYDKLYLWNKYLVMIDIKYIRQNEMREIEVDNYIQDCIIPTMNSTRKRKIKLSEYWKYLQYFSNTIIDTKTLRQIIQDIQDNILQFIDNKKQKEIFIKDMQNIYTKFKDVATFQDLSINEEFQEDLSEHIVKKRTFIEGPGSQELRRDGLKEVIKLLKKLKLALSEEKINESMVGMIFNQIGFPADNSGIVKSFQINETRISGGYKLQDINQKPVFVKQLLSFNDKQGLLVLQVKDELTYRILQFEIKDNNAVQIQKFQYYPIERKLFVDVQNKKFLILTNEQAQVEINDIKDRFEIKNGKTITNICRVKVNGLQQNQKIKVEKIEDYIYNGKQNYLYILNQDHEIFRTSTQSTKAKLDILQKSIVNGQDTKKVNFRTEQGQKYQNFIKCVNSNYILLKHSNGIDIYDQNYYLKYSIKFEGTYIDAQVIQNNGNEYLIIHYKEKLQCYSFTGQDSSGQRKHVALGQQEEKPKGNSLIDYFYASIIKYGSNAPYQEDMYQEKILQCDKNIIKKLKKYVKNLRNFENLIDLQKISDNVEECIKWGNFEFIVQTRAPLHIASIEQQQLFPLKNGMNNRNSIQQSLQKLQENKGQQQIYFHEQIKAVITEIQMGVYEKILKQKKFDEVKVICTMGRQSLGKSYLLNRLFGTRFNVDSKRCTDGLWMSMSAEEDKKKGKHILYVIIDCEGLFNVRRVIEEELQLVLVCTGISNLTVFNSENNFDRKLDEFFGQLAKLSKNYAGRNYYQGSLLFLVRDIPNRDKDEVLQDFERNIEERLVKNKSIEKKTFKNIIYDALASFENKDDFKEGLIDIKEDIISNETKPNKLNPEQFLESLKLLLAKVYFNDDQDIDQAVLRMKIDENHEKHIQDFVKGSNYLQDKSTKVVFQNLNQGQKFLEQQIFFFTKQDENEKYKFKKEEHPLNQIYHNLFRTNFSEKVAIYDKSIHNPWILDYQNFCQKIIQDRINLVLNNFKSKFTTEEQYKKEFQDKSQQIQNELERNLDLFTMCQYQDKKCRNCDRLCVQKKNHEGQCNCYTDHLCAKECQIQSCKQKGRQCGKPSGHNDNNHYCTESDHYCKSQCSIQGCKNQCKGKLDHPEINHNCQQNHECKQKCSLEGCKEQCSQSLEKNHIHQCQNNKCPFQCVFCGKDCVFQDHFHGKYIKEKNNNKLKQDFNGTTYKIDQHNCGQEHPCDMDCEQDGICECNYVLVKKNKKDQNQKILEYDYTEQTAKRNKCGILIPQFRKKHKEKHDCMKDEPHRCKTKCPECKIYCESEIGHDGPHFNAQHRNKDNAIYAGMNQNTEIIIEKDGQTYSFKIGDSAENEKCMSSCIRKGRAHVHLIQCKGGNQCYEKQLGKQKAKHVEQNLTKNENKKYDQILCQAYFELYNWEPPAKGEEQDIINLCSFACNHYEHKKDKEEAYCEKEAWHQGEHYVGHQHKSQFEKIQVAFLLDCTQSMQVYIDGTKKAIQNIIQQFIAKFRSKNNIEFGVVGYKDHQKSNGWDEKYPVKIQHFTDEKNCQNFVGQLREGGGYDTPEALIDGLYGITEEMQWGDEALKFVFLITDAPPHGDLAGDIYDQYPSGCPCNKDLDDLLQAVNDLDIRFKFAKIGDDVNLLADYLQNKLKEYETLELDKDVRIEEVMATSLFVDLNSGYFEFRED